MSLIAHASRLIFLAAGIWVTRLAMAQDSPQVLRGDALPKQGVCSACQHGEEAIAAGAQYKDKTFLFCNGAELEAFLKDPEGQAAPPKPGNATAVPT